jgi:Protein of unknown function (DUF3617)
MNSKHLLPAVAALLLALSAAAQKQAPGLWESSMLMQSAGGEMEKAQADMQAKLAAMPPEQRQKIEQMMASRGVSMGSKGGTMIVKVCISKEQAAKPAEPRLTGDCTQSDMQRSASSMKFKFVCTKPIATSGTGEWSFASDKSYTGKVVSVSQINGKEQPVNLEMSGKWLGADCGDIKPRDTATGQ